MVTEEARAAVAIVNNNNKMAQAKANGNQYQRLPDSLAAYTVKRFHLNSSHLVCISCKTRRKDWRLPHNKKPAESISQLTADRTFILIIFTSPGLIIVLRASLITKKRIRQIRRISTLEKYFLFLNFHSNSLLKIKKKKTNKKKGKRKKTERFLNYSLFFDNNSFNLSPRKLV